MSRNIERRRLGEQAYDILTSQILSGKYPAGMHLSEIHLCSELGISRTPVREALYRLEEKGLVISHPNRGFFVPSLSKRVVQENYPILATLDALALKNSPPFSSSDLRELKKINEKIRKAQEKPLELYQLDLDFHDVLTRNCHNERLLLLAENLKGETRQRDGGYRRGLAGRDLAYKEHNQIIALLENGENHKAALALEKHWLGGIQTVTTWIDSKERKNESVSKKSA